MAGGADPYTNSVVKTHKSKLTNEATTAIKSSNVPEQYKQLLAFYLCSAHNGKHCFPHPRAGGEHLHLDNHRLTLWACAWVHCCPCLKQLTLTPQLQADDETGAITLHQPPEHHLFDADDIKKQTSSVNLELHKQKKKDLPKGTHTHLTKLAKVISMDKKPKHDAAQKKGKLNPPNMCQQDEGTSISSQKFYDIIALSSSPLPPTPTTL